MGLVIAALLVFSVSNAYVNCHGAAVAYGDPFYSRVVTIVREFHGKTVCPQDPSIPVFALGQPGRCLVHEYDTAGWPPIMPDYFFDQLNDADYVITLGGEDDWRNWPFEVGQKERLLRENDFEQISVPELNGSAYTLWKRR